mgnify:CR=1 FL=1
MDTLVRGLLLRTLLIFALTFSLGALAGFTLGHRPAPVAIGVPAYGVGLMQCGKVLGIVVAYDNGIIQAFTVASPLPVISQIMDDAEKVPTEHRSGLKLPGTCPEDL